MRSYRQYCALARALDIVGGRWTLLIIRELFARDCRYSDLLESLPGIATNLLAERLRDLEAEGLVESYRAPAPVRATVYRLTPRGRQLSPVLRALLEWGAPLAEAGRRGDAFRTHWMMLGLRSFYEGVDVADLAPLTVLVRTGDEPMTIEAGEDGLWIEMGQPVSPDVTVAGEPEEVRQFLTGSSGGRIPAGVSVTGPPAGRQSLRKLVGRSKVAKTPARSG